MPVTFAEFVIDERAAELRRNGQAIKIEPQVFDLIVYLASNPGRILTKDDIVQSVWHGRAISDSAISTRINAARRALGDDGATQRFIKTVHGRGFRFDAQLAAVEPEQLVARSNNVPIPATTFIGRDGELTSIKSMLGRPEVRLVSLTGVGGAGKTRIAQKVAIDVAPAFRDGVWFVDLAPLRDSGLVASTIARTLGVQEAKGQPILQRLSGYLNARNTLLVLDNFEHVLPAASLVADLLGACPDVRILVTSRATLRLAGEHEFRVPPLGLPHLEQIALGSAGDQHEPSEAEHLFMARAQAVNGDLTSTPETCRAVAEICLRLDGLPLAIELAAARTRMLTPSELLQRLTRRLPVLSAGPRDMPARQQTLRKTIEWSHELLGAPEQRLFHQLSVFAGGFTSEAAEAIARDLLGVDVLDALGLLLDHSLVQRKDVAGRSRFSMLETVREFAAEKLEHGADASGVRQLHARYYRALAEEGEAHIRGADQEAWLAHLAREHSNMRAALMWAFDDGGDVELGAQLAGQHWWFWSVRGHFSEGRAWTARAMQAADELSVSTRARLVRAQANFAFVQGDYANARVLAAEAAAAFRQLGVPVDAVWLQGLEAIAAQYHGDVTQARQLLENALRVARPLKHDWTIAWMVRNLGRIAHDTDNDPAAVVLLEESLALTRRIGDVRGIALSLHYLGVIALDRDADQASRYLQECVGLFRLIDDRRGLAWALHYLAAAALARGLSTDSYRLETESLSLRQDLGDRRGIAECLEGHASRMTLEGQAVAAIRLFATAAAIRGSLGTPGSPADQRRTQKHLELARATTSRKMPAKLGASAQLQRSKKQLVGLVSQPFSDRDTASLRALRVLSGPLFSGGFEQQRWPLIPQDPRRTKLGAHRVDIRNWPTPTIFSPNFGCPLLSLQRDKRTEPLYLWGLRLGTHGIAVVPIRAGGGRSGTTRRFTLGRYGAITVDEARDAAKKVLGSVAHGDDPAGQRHAKRREMTVATLVDMYAEKGSDHLKERNRRNMLAQLQHHVVPLLGHKRISDVRVADIEQFIRDVKVGKTAKRAKGQKLRSRINVRGGPGAATKAVRDLSAVFTFAVRQERLPSNPCGPVKKPADGQRTRYLSIDEMKRLGSALDAMESEGMTPMAIAIMRLWALTGCRRDEIAGLKWSEVDFERACLRLEATKTGRSVRPLAGAAIGIIKTQSRTDGSVFVFPSADGTTYYQGTKRLWVRVVQRAGLEGVTPHTLRHTIGSAAVSSDETLAMTGALLGHANSRSTSIYAHMLNDPARQAAHRVVGPIATASCCKPSPAIRRLRLFSRPKTAAPTTKPPNGSGRR